jgi:hypothetical protein
MNKTIVLGSKKKILFCLSIDDDADVRFRPVRRLAASTVLAVQWETVKNTRVNRRDTRCGQLPF